MVTCFILYTQTLCDFTRIHINKIILTSSINRAHTFFHSSTVSLSLVWFPCIFFNVHFIHSFILAQSFNLPISLFLSRARALTLSLATNNVHRSRPFLRFNFSITRVEAPGSLSGILASPEHLGRFRPWLIHRQHPLALLIIRSRQTSGRQVFIFSTIWGCARRVGTRIPSPEQGHVQTHHPIIVIVSKLTHIHQLASAPSNLVVFVLCLIAL